MTRILIGFFNTVGKTKLWVSAVFRNVEGQYVQMETLISNQVFVFT